MLPPPIPAFFTIRKIQAKTAEKNWTQVIAEKVSNLK
jgi:hypothetical protein